MQNPIRAAIYARYSGGGQNEQSIEGQLRVCREHAAREGMAVAAVFADRAISGRTDARPEFQSMIARAKKKEFDAVLVYKLDRFSRNKVHSAVYKHELKKHGVRVVSATEQIGDTPEGALMESLMEGMAEFYSANLSQNIRRGNRESADKGQKLGGPAPFGYRVEDKKLVVDGAEAEIVREAFRRYARGDTMQAICDGFRAAGMAQRNGAPFLKATLKKWFGSDKYGGVMRYKSYDARGIPAIVDPETLAAVRRVMAEKRRAGAAAKAKVPFALTGKVFCGECGRRASGNAFVKKGRLFAYCCCSGNTKYELKSERCGSKRARKDALERQVLDMTAAHLLTDDVMDYVAEKALESLADGSADARARLEKELRTLERLVEKCVDALLDAGSELVAGKIKERLAKAERRMDEAAAELALLPDEMPMPTKREIVDRLVEIKSGGAGGAGIIAELVKRVYVYENMTLVWYSVVPDAGGDGGGGGCGIGRECSE